MEELEKDIRQFIEQLTELESMSRVRSMDLHRNEIDNTKDKAIADTYLFCISSLNSFLPSPTETKAFKVVDGVVIPKV
jgi:hypothetical protein